MSDAPLLVIRHASARPARRGEPDEARPLTRAGRQDAATLARFLRHRGVVLDLVVHSPFLRAVETAEALVPLLGPGGQTQVASWLASAPTLEALSELLPGRVALVGHEPFLSQACGLLLARAPRRVGWLSLAKGAVVTLDGERRPGHMTLTGLVPPALFRRRR